VKRKKIIKNTIKILILASIPIGILIALIGNSEMQMGSVLELASEPLEPIYEIEEAALDGFDIFNAMNRGPLYEVRLTTVSEGVVEMIDDRFELLDFEPSLALDSPQHTLYAVFENFLHHEEQQGRFISRDTFVMKLFLNYEEIAFRPLNQVDFTTAFFFRLDQGYQVHIPFQLSDELEANNYLNQLTVAVFATPERHTIDPLANLVFEGLLELNLGTVSQFDLTFGGEEPIRLRDERTEVHRLSDAGSIINVSPEFSDSDIELGNGLNMPPSPWRVRVGEVIELAFTANIGYFPYWPNPTPEDYPQVENYLLIGLLNWQQIELNAQPYLIIDSTSESGRGRDYGFFSIIAPMEPGFYDFIVFVVPNPGKPRAGGVFSSEGGRGIPWSPYSIRFTIEVMAH